MRREQKIKILTAIKAGHLKLNEAIPKIHIFEGYENELQYKGKTYTEIEKNVFTQRIKEINKIRLTYGIELDRVVVIRLSK